MAEPTLAEVFGANATQDATDLVIKKSDLPATNFTPSSTNRAEQLLVAMIQKIATKLNETNQTSDPDIQITVEPSFNTVTTVNGIPYKVFTYTISLRKPDTDTVIKPNDF
jgi:hypothetical protein